MDELDWTEKELLRKVLDKYAILYASDDEREDIEEIFEKLEL